MRKLTRFRGAGGGTFDVEDLLPVPLDSSDGGMRALLVIDAIDVLWEGEPDIAAPNRVSSS